MKVIKSGSPPKPWTAIVYCTGVGNGGGGCMAHLEVSLSDLYETYRSDMYGDIYARYTTFTCVECGVETDIEYEGPKAAIQSKAAWRKKQKEAAHASFEDKSG